MCKLLGVIRSLVYYKRKNKRVDVGIEKHIIEIFKNSKNNYGARKIKVELQKLGYQVSKKRIRKYMIQMDWFQILQSNNLKYIKQHVMRMKLKIS